ncbi:MAG: hypothetical protein IKC89_00135, partial [Lentisphaeria bacterium]|nr:hypothetical protein [Lentisphaeria bacterium]
MDKLLQPAVSGDDISLLQRYIGQSLLGENFSQTFLLLTGTGGGRKSTLVNIEKKSSNVPNVPNCVWKLRRRIAGSTPKNLPAAAGEPPRRSCFALDGCSRFSGDLALRHSVRLMP